MGKKIKSINIGSVKLPYFSSRYFSLVLYQEKNIVKKICDDENNILDYIFICHDKDTFINDNGESELKKPHIHLLIKCNCPYYSSTIYNKFHIDDNNVLVVCPQDLSKDVQYLIHLNDKEKFQYSKDELVYNSNFFFKYFDKTIINEFDELSLCCLDIARGMKRIDLLKKYGQLYVKNYSSLSIIASELKFDVLCLDEENFI